MKLTGSARLLAFGLSRTPGLLDAFQQSQAEGSLVAALGEKQAEERDVRSVHGSSPK